MEKNELVNVIEAALLASGNVLSIDKILSLFPEDAQPDRQEIREALETLSEACEGRGIELHQVQNGFRLQVKQAYAPWVSKLWEERPPRYSRALLETLALIAYKQPITRAEIEDVRGVAVSTNIMKTLQEREWVRVVGHRDVPGRPALYATTREFLEYFSLKGLEELPSLAEIRDIESINAELDLEGHAESTQGDLEQAEIQSEQATQTQSEVPEGTEADNNEMDTDDDEQIDAAVAAPLEGSR